MLCGVSGQRQSVRTFGVTTPGHLRSCSPRRAVVATGLRYGPLIKLKNKQTPPSEQPPGSSRSRSVSPAPGRDRHRRVRARRWVGGSGGAGGPGSVPEGVSLRHCPGLGSHRGRERRFQQPRQSRRDPAALHFALGSRPAAVNTELSCFSR